MHSVSVRKEIAERVLQRRGRYHLFDRLDPARTALVVIDMQGTFCAPGSPAEVPVSRDIVEPINGLTAELRKQAMKEIRESEWFGMSGAPTIKVSPHPTGGLAI